MKKYRLLKRNYISILKHDYVTLEEIGEVLLIPNKERVFLHWHSDSGKLVTTLTLRAPTIIQTPVKIINGSELDIELESITL
jgi:hypothetical protein